MRYYDVKTKVCFKSGILYLFLLIFCPSLSQAQDRPLKNLQVFPKDITRPELIQNMREFSLGIGVRCQYCHTGGDGVSFEGVVFESDEDEDKVKARFMIRMTENLNKQVLASMPQRDTPNIEITCKTCHRGQPKPALLTQSMFQVMETGGREAAVSHYKELRQNAPMSGAFDFGEWEVNLLAERLEKAGRIKDAISIYELNREFYPSSVAIVLSLGRLYEADKNNTTAIRMYERVLELNADNKRAKNRLEALKSESN